MENTDDSLGVRFSPKQSKSKTFCSVYGCNSKACKNFDVRFHYFPKQSENFIKIQNAFGVDEKIDSRKMWQKVLKIGKSITENMQVCSLHFKKSDYFFPENASKGKRRLKKNALPSCNLPCTEIKTTSSTKINDDREKRRIQRDKKKNTIISDNEATNNEKPDSSARLTTTELTFDFDGQRNSVVLDDTNPSPVTSRENNNGSVVAMLPEKNDETPAKTFIDVGIQVKSGDLVTDFCDVIKTEKKLNTLTGIVSFDILNTILDVFKLCSLKGFALYFSKQESRGAHQRHFLSVDDTSFKLVKSLLK
ncbi:hypothetical protein KQX54_009295 [Cotesia glomerata]|uniref:THAP-type domain-containing protein n=1 Tax=Cotesia glomerata TaxID=32391 RepID=A0AAV7IYF2_COTGL|nr:hypothetical protein KQX54_009295 [Cotesia glomerata]